jgi:uracil-DNA glycosylase family protein
LRRARLMLVGEMPGDQEDRHGKPFVGPAGRLLDQALAAAAISRKDAYVTNVVKHFKWEPRGRRRIHKRPLGGEVQACLPWLELEIELVEPEALICLGATATHALIGRGTAVASVRGRFVSLREAIRMTATVHPSALRRMPDGNDREQAFHAFVADLAFVRRTLDN